MCFVIHYEDDPSGREKQSPSYCDGRDYLRDVYIPKKLVVAVTKYDTFSHHANIINYYHPNDDKKRELHWLLIDMFDPMGIEKCKCLDESKDWAEDGMDPACKGIERLYPLYQVRVKNLYPETNGPDGEILPVCSYYLHPSEREHMERFLAGTDDPLYDFVHELRYNPRAAGISPELERAREDFEGERKKQRVD